MDVDGFHNFVVALNTVYSEQYIYSGIDSSEDYKLLFSVYRDLLESGKLKIRICQQSLRQTPERMIRQIQPEAVQGPRMRPEVRQKLQAAQLCQTRQEAIF